jgi:hypothetical protein
MEVEGPKYPGYEPDNGPELDDPNLAFLAAIIGVINITLLLVMLSIYLSSYRRLKSPFTMGLIVFTALLILQNLLFIVFLLVTAGFHGPGMGGPVLVLLKITGD